MDKAPGTSPTSDEKGKRPLKRNLGVSVRFVRQKSSKKESVAKTSSNDDEPSRIEVEEQATPSTRRRSSSWLTAMFTKSQSNAKSDKVSTKQSVFPGNSNLLKKKARNTILSVLTKRQTQEKIFLGEKAEGRPGEPYRAISSSEPSLQKTSWSPEPTVIDDATPYRSKPQRPTSVVVRSKSYQFTPSTQPRPSSNVYDGISSRKTHPTGITSVPHEVTDVVVLQETDSLESGVDSLTTWPRKAPGLSSYEARARSDHSLGNRRPGAPRELPRPLEQSSVQTSEAVERGASTVVAIPSYTCKKDILPEAPLSPKSVSDSVIASIPFQVQSQRQSAKADPRSDPWSSSVSVCVPFQVKKCGEGVPVLPTSDNQPVPHTSSEVRAAYTPSSTISGSPKVSRVRLASTETCEILDSEPETENPVIVTIVTPVLAAVPLKSEVSESSVDAPDSKVSEVKTDGGAVTKLRAHSSPTPDKRKSRADERSKAKKVTKELSKTMGKEASKHKTTEKLTTTTMASGKLSPGPGGKPRAKSFTAGEKLAVSSTKEKSPSSTPAALSPAGTPAGTPKSRSPASSPRLGRRNAAQNNVNMNKPRLGTPELKRGETKGRPSSDPMIAEKLASKKRAPVSDTDHSSRTGKSKPDTEVLKQKIVELEDERNKSLEQLQTMEQQLAVVPLLEKEKLQLQKQLDEITQHHEKQKNDFNNLEEYSKKLSDEKNEFQTKHANVLTESKNVQVELQELKEQNRALDEVKCTLARENEQKLEAIDKHLDNIEKLTTANTHLVLKEGRLRNRISTLSHGLRTLRDSVIDLKEENKYLQAEIIENGSELVGTMKNCVSGLQKVIVGLKEKSDEESRKRESKVDVETQCNELQSTENVLEELRESKERVESLLNKINELEMEKSSNGEEKDNRDRESIMASQCLQTVMKGDFACPGCKDLQGKLELLQGECESQKIRLQKSESERDEALEENIDLNRETKYLKYVLSYRQDVQCMQMSQQQNKEMEKMGANLVEAEKKVNDLEGEVDRLQAERQTLLMSILNLNCIQSVEDVNEEAEDEDDTAESDESDEEAADNKQRDKNEVQVQEGIKTPDFSSSSRTPDSISRREQLKFRFQLSVSESDYSYSSERTDGEEGSETEREETDNELSSQTTAQLKSIKLENQHLKSTLSEAAEEKEELLTSLDKLCEEFDTLKDRYDKLEKAHAQLSDKAKNDKKALQARLKDVENERAKMRDSLRQIQDEKLALLRCLEMKNTEGPPQSPLSETELNQIIARAQSLAEQENKHSEPTSNEEESEESSSSSEEEEEAPPLPRKKTEIKESPEKRVGPEGEPDKPLHRQTEDRELQSIVASIENDLGILKEKLKRKGNDGGDVKGGVQPIPAKPPPGARILRRQASTVKSNLDRVCREKQHLEDEVESLRRYLLKRRDSVMDTKRRPSVGSLKRATTEVENHLGAIKTLQGLLEKSDDQLRQSNEVISRLESLNDDTEDKLRDAEVLQDDLRRAVQIANNFAMEEQEKADDLAKRNQELMRQIEILKTNDKGVNTSSPASKKLKRQLKAARPVSEDESLYGDDEGAVTTEGESDFYSSRHSSVASESDFVRSPSPEQENDLSERSHSTSNASVVSRGASEEECSTKGGDTETEGTSQPSSTAETSDTEDDNDNDQK